MAVPSAVTQNAYARWPGAIALDTTQRAAIPVSYDAWLGDLQPWRSYSDATLSEIREFADREGQQYATQGTDYELLTLHYDVLLDGCEHEIARRKALESPRYTAQPRFDVAFLQDLKARVPVYEYAEFRGEVNLHRAGHDRYVSLCPRHSENTPSFSAWSDHFHCFGCGWGGDLFAFIEDTDGCDFVHAVQEVARYAGVSLPLQGPPPIYQRAEYRR